MTQRVMRSSTELVHPLTLIVWTGGENSKRQALLFPIFYNFYMEIQCPVSNLNFFSAAVKLFVSSSKEERPRINITRYTPSILDLLIILDQPEWGGGAGGGGR